MVIRQLFLFLGFLLLGNSSVLAQKSYVKTNSVINDLPTSYVHDGSVEEGRYFDSSFRKSELSVSAKFIKTNWSPINEIEFIEVENPFWNTMSFFILLGIMSIILLVIMARMISGKLEKKKLKHIVDEQIKDLQTALQEKEVLIKEIHHRVKNNLAVVSGLLEMQSWSLPEGEAKNAIMESKLRVLAMAKIHENLYQNNDLARVNFKKFLADLVQSISTTMKDPKQEIEVELEVHESLINVNMGIPIGLVVNELISNCYKHAFEGRESGKIFIKFENLEKYYYLVIKDDGTGSEDDILNIEIDSLGITLVKSLTSQIGADINYSGVDGSIFELTIPKSKTDTTY